MRHFADAIRSQAILVVTLTVAATVAFPLASPALSLTWSIETVDRIGFVGEYTSLALDGSDNPRISYRDAFNYDLKYAAWSGSSWDIETVDGYGFSAGHAVFVAEFSQ